MDLSQLQGKRLVVLGAGYVGGLVARQAAKAGADVVALTRNPDTAADLERDGVACLVAPLHENGWHSAIEPRADFVVNTVSSAGGGMDGYRLSYVQGQASLVQWARQGAIGRSIFTSATSVYPQSEGEWVDESSPTAGCSQAGQLLLESERVLLEADAPIQRRCVLRLAGIYGPGRHLYLNQLQAGECTFQTDADGYLNLIHQEDAATAILAALLAPELPEQSVYNVADGQPAAKRTIVTWLAAQVGLGAATLAFEAPAQSSRRRLPNGQLPNRRVRVDRARAELGWSPKFADFRQGYRAILSRLQAASSDLTP
ncbi:MAG: NAD-dependent epimerase/dehydratase family protein [Opitutales bacterium]